MAIVTTQISTLGTSFLEATYDDITGDLTSGRIVCGDTPVVGRILRANGSVWREAIVTSGEQSFVAGGPIRNFSDVPQWYFGTL